MNDKIKRIDEFKDIDEFKTIQDLLDKYMDAYSLTCSKPHT